MQSTVPEQTQLEVELKMIGFKRAQQNGELDHLDFPRMGFKEKCQLKLQRLINQMQRDPEDNLVIKGNTIGNLQTYILSAVRHLIETDQTNRLMDLLVENFGDELAVM